MEAADSRPGRSSLCLECGIGSKPGGTVAGPLVDDTVRIVVPE